MVRNVLASTLVTLTPFERDVVVAELGDTVLAAACRMRDRRVGCLVVVRDGRPIGILTDRDLVLRVVAEGKDPARVHVSDVVTYEATTVLRTDGLETAISRMRTYGVRRMPIVDEEGRLTGIITADDIVSLLTRQLGDVGAGIADNVDGSESR